MTRLSLVRDERAATICKLFDLRGGAEKLLVPTHTPAQFLDLLIEQGYLSNATRFLAHALPLREAIWWGCLCLRLASTEPMSDAEEKALAAAVRWVVKPTPQSRTQAEAQVAAADETAAGNLARAVAVSAGNSPPTPGPGTRNRRALAAALRSASTRNGKDLSAQYAHKFLTVGKEVANGSHRWT